MQRRQNEVDRYRQHRGRNGPHQERAHGDRRTPGKAETGNRVGAHGAEDQRQDRRDDADDDAVAEVAEETAFKHAPVVLEGRHHEEREIAAEDLALGLQRGREHDEDRQDR